MNNFDEAKELASEMIENPSENQEEAAPAEQQENSEETPSEAEQLTQRAVETADNAAQIAQQKAADVEALKNENEHLKALLNETRESNQEAIDGLKNNLPVLDLSNLAFDDEEQIKERTADYTKQILEFAEKNAETNLLKKLEPIISKAQRAAEAQEHKEVLGVLEQIPELSGISGMAPQLDEIISKHRALQNPELSTEEKYITALAIAQGVNSMNEQKKEHTYDDFVNMYENSPELQQFVERKRADRLKESQQVPNLSASNGAGSAALNIPNKPKSFDEAKSLVRKLFKN